MKTPLPEGMNVILGSVVAVLGFMGFVYVVTEASLEKSPSNVISEPEYMAKLELKGKNYEQR